MAFLRKIASRHMQFIAGLGAVGVFAVSYYPHTLGLGQYQSAMQMYKDGQPWPVDGKVLDLMDKLIPVAGIKPAEEVNLEFFSVYGHSPVHKGSVKLRTGAVVGIPGYYAYTTTEQVCQSKMEVRGKTVDWDSEGGQMLQSALVLSDKAKAFALARELFYVQQQQGLICSLIKAVSVVVFYTVGFASGNLFQLKIILKPWARCVLYGLIGLLGVGTAAGVEDLYLLHSDRKADTKAANIAPYFSEGGLELCDKIMVKNKALRLLMGRHGPRLYTAQGAEVVKWRYDHIPETHRAENLQAIHKKHLEQLKQKESSETQPS